MFLLQMLATIVMVMRCRKVGSLKVDVIHIETVVASYVACVKVIIVQQPFHIAVR